MDMEYIYARQRDYTEKLKTLVDLLNQYTERNNIPAIEKLRESIIETKAIISALNIIIAATLIKE